MAVTMASYAEGSRPWPSNTLDTGIGRCPGCFGLKGTLLTRSRSTACTAKKVYRSATKRRKKRTRPRAPRAACSRCNGRSSMDCVSDQLATGRRIRILNVIDVSISGARVANEFDHLRKHRQLPEAIVCDNGREFRSKAMFLWSQRRSIKLQFIQPGKPSRNAGLPDFFGPIFPRRQLVRALSLTG